MQPMKGRMRVPLTASCASRREQLAAANTQASAETASSRYAQ